MVMTDSELKKFKKILKEENLKMTPQRIEVFREVCDSNEHRESEEIRRQILYHGTDWKTHRT